MVNVMVSPKASEWPNRRTTVMENMVQQRERCIPGGRSGHEKGRIHGAERNSKGSPDENLYHRNYEQRRGNQPQLVSVMLTVSFLSQGPGTVQNIAVQEVLED